MQVFKLLIIIAVIWQAYSTTAEPICPKEELLCGDGSKCIQPIKLCDYTPDCDDSSDETNFQLCKTLTTQKRSCPGSVLNVKCSANYNDRELLTYSYLRNKCMDIFSACSLGNKCLGPIDAVICSEIEGNLLKPSEVIKEKTLYTIPEYDNSFYEMVNFINDAFNETVKRNFTSCPPFFTSFRGKCYSFFVPAQVTWSNAKLFCESMSSRLAVLDDIHKFKTVLDFIKVKGLKSNFWIGGYAADDIQNSENSTKKWTWLNKKPVAMGAPFWSLSLVNPTLNYVCDKVEKSIRPRSKHTEEMCLALLEDNNYYFSDEKCNERLSPICFLN